MTIAHIFNGELGFDVRAKLNDVIDIANAAGGGGGTTILDGSGPPASGLGAVGDYYVDETGNQMYGPKQLVAAEEIAIPPATVPAATGSGGYELGGRFTFAVNGQITAVRYYRDATASQIAHTVSVWTTGGTLLASGSVANDGGGSGWKQVALTSALAVTASSTLVVSTGFPGAVFARTNGPGFPISNGGNVSITTGVYGGLGAMPPTTDNTNFFVDVVFEPAGVFVPFWPMAVDGDAGGGGGGMAIGGSITSATVGSVLFAGAAGVLAQDNTSFFWDATLKDLHIGGAYYVNAARALYVMPHVNGNNWFEGSAGNQTLTGYDNFGTGDRALNSLTTGYRNVAVGTGAMQAATDAAQNFALGSNAMHTTLNDSNNVAIGFNALYELGNLGTGGGGNANNLAMGFAAASALRAGTNNVAIGFQALGVVHPTTANANTIVGAAAGNLLGSGGGSSVQNNTLIGINAGAYLTGTSSYNTFIGGYQGQLPTGILNNAIAISSGSGINALLDCHVITGYAWSFNAFGNGVPVSVHFYNYVAAPAPGNYYGTVNYERVILDWQYNSNIFNIGMQAGGTGVKRLIAIDGFAKAGAPAAGDLPASTFSVIDDTSGGATWLVFNKAGTIRKVQLT